MKNKNKAEFPGIGSTIGVVTGILVVTAAIWLLWSGHGNIRYTADHGETMPIWHKWIPALVGIALIRLIPFKLPYYQPLGDGYPRRILHQTWILVSACIIFMMGLLLVGEEHPAFQLWYMLLKLIFLLLVPWLVLRFYRGSSSTSPPHAKPQALTRWHWFAPLVVLTVWAYINFFTGLSVPYAASELTEPVIAAIFYVLIGFFINGVLEELFYRVWLQTRLERLLGVWPAILLTSILWAIWHIAIQGTGEWQLDLATVIANHGVTGIFLGYLWAKYRNVWVLFIVHGLINASPRFLLDIWLN
ncbi:CPBP family intramembrane glutamic endopeptidase [Paenibacillus sp. 1P07SE]|uniref:CPBP family intramembrane glutamic endopeptidase n=1 Tax=Paenibacillus sp. 1P07SE TaxID=3132209 RepID=UPI0039A66C8B